MKNLSQDEAKRITDKVLSYSKGDQCEVTITGSRKGNIRYARNAVSTAGLIEDTQLVVAVAFGKKQGIATINEFDDKSLEKAVRRAEDLARLAPENPEFMATPGKQEYKASQTFFQSTADIDPEFRAQVAAYSIENSKKNKLVAAGFFSDTTQVHSRRQFQRRVRLPAGRRPGLHRHRAHRRRPRFGLGQAQRRRRPQVRRARSVQHRD